MNADRITNLQVVHELAETPYDTEVNVRRNKETVLADMGFHKGTNIAQIVTFDFTHSDAIEHFFGHLESMVQSGRSISILVIKEEYANAGGCPVIYIRNIDDIRGKFVFEGDKLFVRTQNDEYLELTAESNVKTYARSRGHSAQISELDNYAEKEVTLAGGFRLQVDDIHIQDGELVLGFSGSFSFDDMGSRVLALGSESDQKVPRKKITFELVYRDGHLVMADEGNTFPRETLTQCTAEDICKEVVRQLLAKDELAVTRLLRILLTAKPANGIHSLEGMYSVNDLGISSEVIDFDGIDSLDEVEGEASISMQAVEILIKRYLVQSGFLVTDITAFKDYLTFTQQMNSELVAVLSIEGLDEAIKQRLQSNLLKSQRFYEPQLESNVRLARFLTNLCIQWNQYQGIRYVDYGSNRFIIVTIGGLDIAFWVIDGTIQEYTPSRGNISQIGEILDQDIPMVYLSNLHEGD